MALTQKICPKCLGVLEYKKLENKYECPKCLSVFEDNRVDGEVEILLNSIREASSNSDLFGKCVYKIQDLFDRSEDAKKNPYLYWILFLAKNKISYVDDKKDGKRKPVQMDESIFSYKKDIYSDKDSKKAIDLSDGDDKNYFLEQAKYIENIRLMYLEKDFLEKYRFDVFISFKKDQEVEIIDNGVPRKIRIDTEDKKIADELYEILTAQKLKVFYSEKTLKKDMTGEEYESVIFQAIASSKAFLLVGTKPEYVYEGWVRSEWERYLYYMDNYKNERNSLYNKVNNSFIWVVESNDKTEFSKFPPAINKLQAIERNDINFKDKIISKVKDLINLSTGVSVGKINLSNDFKKKETQLTQKELKKFNTSKKEIKKETVAENIEAKKIEYISQTVKIDSTDNDMIDMAFYDIKNQHYMQAKSKLEDVLSKSKIAKAYYGLLLCNNKASNISNFIGHSTSFNDFDLLDKIIESYPSEDLVKDLFNMSQGSLEFCFENNQITQGLKFFTFIVKNDTQYRSKAINYLKEQVYNREKKFDDFNKFDSMIKEYLLTFDAKDVDKYMEECLKLASFINATYPAQKQLSIKYVEKALSIDKSNYRANCDLFCYRNERDSLASFREDPIFSEYSIEAFENMLRALPEERSNREINTFIKYYVDYSRNLKEKTLRINKYFDYINNFAYLLSLTDYGFKSRDIMVVLNNLLDNYSINVLLDNYRNVNIYDIVIEKCLSWVNDVDTRIEYLVKLGKKARCLAKYDQARDILSAALSYDDGNPDVRYELLCTDLLIDQEDYKGVFQGQIKKIFEMPKFKESFEKLLGSLIHQSSNGTDKLAKAKLIDILYSITESLVNLDYEKSFANEAISKLGSNADFSLGNYFKDLNKLFYDDTDTSKLYTNSSDVEKYGDTILGYAQNLSDKTVFNNIALKIAQRMRLNGNFDKAIKFYQIVINNESKNFDAHYGLLMCNYRANHLCQLLVREKINTTNDLYKNLLMSAHYKSNQKNEYHCEYDIVSSISSIQESIQRQNKTSQLTRYIEKYSSDPMVLYLIDFLFFASTKNEDVKVSYVIDTVLPNMTTLQSKVGQKFRSYYVDNYATELKRISDAEEEEKAKKKREAELAEQKRKEIAYAKAREIQWAREERREKRQVVMGVIFTIILLAAGAFLYLICDQSSFLENVGLPSDLGLIGIATATAPSLFLLIIWAIRKNHRKAILLTFIIYVLSYVGLGLLMNIELITAVFNDAVPLDSYFVSFKFIFMILTLSFLLRKLDDGSNVIKFFCYFGVTLYILGFALFNMVIAWEGRMEHTIGLGYTWLNVIVLALGFVNALILDRNLESESNGGRIILQIVTVFAVLIICIKGLGAPFGCLYSEGCNAAEIVEISWDCDCSCSDFFGIIFFHIVYLGELILIAITQFLADEF